MHRVLAAATCLATLLLLAAPSEAGEGWWGGLDEGEAVSLNSVLRQPEEFRGRTLTFYCVFFTADGTYKYYPPNTAFTEGNFLNFSVWPDGTPVWEKEAFVENFPFLYLRRTNAQREELVRIKRFTRLECTGRIRDIVRGRPAIEVFSFRETGHRLGKPIVDSVLWGMNYAKQGTREGYQSAARRFKEALQPDLPPVYAIIVRKLLADALRALGNDAEADLYERGETVGTPPLPRADPGAAPGMPLAPGEAFPTDFPEPPSPDDTLPGSALPGSSGDMPAPPAPLGTARGAPDGPGASAPRPEAGFPPAAGGFPPATPEGLPTPPANPFLSDDLPGRVAGGGRGSLEKTPDSELPGRTAPGTAPSRSRAASPRSRRAAPGGRPSGIPPKRRPRLSGVK